MDKFDLARYQAFHEAGYTSEEELYKIDEFYQAQARRGEATYEQYVKVRAGVIDKVCKRVVLAMIALGTMFMIGSIPTQYHQIAQEDEQNRVQACSSGNAVSCYAAVNYELRTAVGYDANGNHSDAQTHKDEAGKLLLAYRIQTGHALEHAK